MNFSNLVMAAKALPKDISVLIRGDHGIGKSQVVYQLGKEFNLPVVERRLSQMEAGDIIGLPKLEGGVTKFLPPDWVMRAVTEPVVLFLDEINRATPEVMQAAFQLVLDRQLNGHKLHEGTRVFAAINTNSKYQVNEMDPALLDRFWVCDLEPTEDDFFAWAKGEIEVEKNGKKLKTTRLHSVVIDYLQKHPKSIWTGKAVEPGDVAPSPRSWERLDKSFKQAEDVLDKDVQADAGLQNLVYTLAVGLVGLETARSLVDYVKTLDRQVTALDILDNFEKNKKRIEALGQEKWNICIDRVTDHMKEQVLSKKQADNFGKFLKVLPDELIIHVWTCIASASAASETRDKNIGMIKEHLVPEIIRITKPTVDAMKAQLEQKK